MEKELHSSSQLALCSDVELGKQNKPRNRGYQCAAVILCFIFLLLALCVFGLSYMWNTSSGKMYRQEYKALLNGVETDGTMEINPAKRLEIFRVGNGSEEILEIHDFYNGLAGIRFSKHQRCHIRNQTKKLPKPDLMDTTLEVEESGEADLQVVESSVWIPAEQPITDTAFLRSSNIWELCQDLPIYWMFQTPLRDAELHAETQQPAETQVRLLRQTRDITDELPVNDYSEAGLELDSSLDDQGYCCHYCRRGYRYCRRYYEPLGGHWPYPYWYQGVVCQIVMPCNWWIARMLGRV